MADLDIFVNAVKKAAEKVELICDPTRTQIVFVIEKVVENPGFQGNPQLGLQLSLSSVVELADGSEDEKANELIKNTVAHFSR